MLASGVWLPLVGKPSDYSDYTNHGVFEEASRWAECTDQTSSRPFLKQHLRLIALERSTPSSRAEGELRFPRLSQFLTPISHLNFPSSPFLQFHKSTGMHAFIHSGVPRNFKDPSLDNQGDHLGEYRERERRAIGRAITGGAGAGAQ